MILTIWTVFLPLCALATDFEDFLRLLAQPNHSPDKSALFPILKSGIIGSNATFTGPFGVRKVVYADYFASGKSLQMIEDHIESIVLPQVLLLLNNNNNNNNH